MRKMIALTLGIALYAGTALARPPGPDEIGEFYVYFDTAGQVVGQASMDCDGNLHETGVRTSRYSVGYAICLPGDD
jgi:hypothetical protein